MNPNKQSAYTILHDQLLSMANVDGSRQQVGSISIPLDLHTEFDATGSTIASINSGAIYLLLLSTELTNTPVFSYESRVQYVDN